MCGKQQSPKATLAYMSRSMPQYNWKTVWFEGFIL